MPHLRDTANAEGEALAHALAGTPYRFLCSLGRGGMGTVVEAEHRTLGVRVALKLLHEPFATRPDLVDRLRLEAQALARLAGPEVVRVTDLGTTPSGRPFYVMERLEGRTLADELGARVLVDVDEALAIVRALLRALAAAHAMGIVHRDVKPANVFLARGADGRAHTKLLDFGIAKVLAEAASVPGAPAPLAFATREDVLLGTPWYLAPEQIAGGPISPAVDVYATGLILYTLLAGRHPFAGRSADAVLRAHLEEIPPNVADEAGRGVEPRLARVLARALAKEPRDRFPDARAFLAALDAPLGGPVDVTLSAAPAVSAPRTRLQAVETARPARGAPLFAGVSLVVATFGVALRGYGLAEAARSARDVDAALLARFGHVPDGAAALVRDAVLPNLMRQSALLLGAITLFGVGLDVAVRGARASRTLHAWVGLGSATTLVAIAIDVAVLAPMQRALLALVDVTSPLGDGFVLATTMGVALFEVAFLVYAAVTARALSRAGAHP